MAQASDFLGGGGSGAAAGSVLGPIGSVVGGITGLLGGLFGGGESAEEKMLRDSMAQIDALEVPPEEKRRIKYELLQKIGEYKPELETAITAKDTELSNVQVDPTLRQAQINALTRLQQVGTEGLTLEDKATLEDALGQSARQASAQQQGILQNAAQRGVLGGGQELAAQLAGNQAAAERNYQGARDIAALAQRRMLEGTLQAGQLGGNLRQQDYGEQSDRAKAQDIINRFNTEMQSGVQQRNVSAKNLGQQSELGYTRDIAAKNTTLRNLQQEKNTDLARQVYQDQLDKARVKANMAQRAGSAADTADQHAKEGWGKVGSTIGQISSAADDYFNKK
jgi:hypothetical protein